MARPRIVFADEPTGNLDTHTAGEVMALLRELSSSGMTLILVTHDAAIAEPSRSLRRDPRRPDRRRAEPADRVSTFVPLAVVPVAGILAFAYVLAARPGIRALALRHATRRRAQAALVIAGIAIATTITTGAVAAGDSLRASIRRSATTQLGPVDEEIVSGDARTAGEVSAALERARPAGVPRRCRSSL